jgi:hypothetical protein
VVNAQPQLPQLADVLATVLTTTADAAASVTCFVQRHSKLTGARFVQTVVLGWLHQPQATLENLAQMAATLGVEISPQGLEKRFSEQASACLKAVLEAAVAQVITAHAAAIPLLHRFTAVLIQDSTVLPLPACLATTWRGCGGTEPSQGAAALKLQVQLDLTTGLVQGPWLQDGRTSDLRAPEATLALPAGALRLADLGYFSLERLRQLSQQDSFWLTRWKVGTGVANEHGVLLDILSWLEQQAVPAVDCPILLGKAAHLPARLIAVRGASEVANQRRRRLKADAQRRGKTLSKARLAAADWTMYLTNVPPVLLTVSEVLVLGRARWQIELLFKLWKSAGSLATSRSGKPWRILCEIYAKLIGLLIQHWLLLTSCWQYPDRSLVKAAQTVHSYAILLANAFAGLLGLERVIHQICRCVGAGCRMNPRKKYPNTYQLLLAPS